MNHLKYKDITMFSLAIKCLILCCLLLDFDFWISVKISWYSDKLHLLCISNPNFSKFLDFILLTIHLLAQQTRERIHILFFSSFVMTQLISVSFLWLYKIREWYIFPPSNYEKHFNSFPFDVLLNKLSNVNMIIPNFDAPMVDKG